GCEEAVVDLAEGILDVVAAADIVFWPVAMDFKKADVEAMEDGSILAAFVNGAIRTTEQEEMAHLLRRKAKVLVAFGSCAHQGGIPGLANLWDRQAIFESSYLTGPSTVNPEGTLPATALPHNGDVVTLPGFYDTVRALDQVTSVDYYIPGCAPTPNIIAGAVQTLLSGDLPPAGTVLAPDKALCEDCPRIDTKPQDLSIERFYRPYEILADESTCLLAQGLLCMGSGTRSGCSHLCINGNMPCSGCFGPTSKVRDHGGKYLSAIASLMSAMDEEAIQKALDTIPDPIGTFYRYGLAGSLLRRRKMTPVA
ncbi:MAG: oxidoreductase, partial [Actinobacteria bacterium]|nr:oxidoreductase [Actinomycetota bacterium]